MNIEINSINAHDSIEHTFKVDFYVKNDEGIELYKIGYVVKFYLLGIPIGDKFEIMPGTLGRGQSDKIEETLVIDPHLFSLIEKRRNRGDIDLRIDVTLLHLRPKQGVDPVTFVTELHSTSGRQINYTISERRWIDLISKMGYMNYAIFEIQYPKVPSIPGFEDIMNRLKEAEQLIYEGKNEDVVTRCRKAVETLNPLVTIDVKNGPMVPTLANNVDNGCKGQQNKPNKSQRVESVRQNIWTLLHIGPHEGYTVTREDAEYIYWMTLSTVRYYAIQFNKP